MRKNLLLILFAILLAASMPLTAFASDASMLTSPDGKYMYSVDENGNATLEKYLADEENETTPTEVDGHPVVAIGAGCFASVWNLLNLIISEGVEHIGESAVSLNYSGEIGMPRPTVKFPSTLKTVGDYAFDGLGSVQIVLPEGVEKLGKALFRYAGVQEIYIPASVTEIGPYLLLATSAYNNSGAPVPIILYVEEGSYAEKYAEENELPHKIGMPEKIIESAVPEITGEYIIETFAGEDKGYEAIDVSKLPMGKEELGIEVILLIIAGAVFVVTMAFFCGVFLRERKGSKL